MHELINQHQYPLDENNLPFDKWKKELKENGLLVLENFIHPERLPELIEEAQKLANKAYFNPCEGNIYLCDPKEEWSTNHPGRRTEKTEVGVVAGDQFEEESLIKAIYENDRLLDFVERIINRGKLYRYNCPLGSLNLAVMKKGNYLRWHFDQSDFVVSIPLQASSQGGRYEYAHNIRSAQEENLEEISKLLEGNYSHVQQLKASPGSLVLFEGRYTAHRVTPIEGDELRLGALLGFVDKADTCSDAYLKKIRYGRES